MSSGPGILQRQIIESIQVQDSSTYQNILLWKIASERAEIEKGKEIYPGLNEGSIHRSFVENYRRAIISLDDNGIIKIKKQKIVAVDEAFDYFPYHTIDLYIHQLRTLLLPTIREYIKEKNPRRFWHCEIEENQIERRKKTRKYKIAQGKWDVIEKNIISILHNTNTNVMDLWLQLLVRGKYLFSDTSIHHNRSFVDLYRLFSEQDDLSRKGIETAKKIKELINLTFSKREWELGEMKSALYKITEMKKFFSDSLNDEIKDHLWRKHKDLLITLHDHKEPKPVTTKRGMTFGWPGERKYSKDLDKLITKQIFRKQNLIQAV